MRMHPNRSHPLATRTGTGQWNRQSSPRKAKGQYSFRVLRVLELDHTPAAAEQVEDQHDHRNNKEQVD